MPSLLSLNEFRRKNKAVKGRWELDSRHRLSYRAEDPSEKFEIQASLVAAEEGALVFSVAGKKEKGRQVTRLAKLSGTWRANDQNQIEFEVERESGQNDVLTFRGEWKLGSSHEIIYRWRRRSPARKTVIEETLVFNGAWDISGQNRLTYRVEGSNDNTLRFRGTFQTRSILAREGEIRYQLGAEAEMKPARRSRTITFFGKWKLSNTLELFFEMDCADGKKRELCFGAEFSPSKDFTVAARLLNKKGDPLGIEVLLSREFLKGHAQAFVKLKKSLAESAVEAGVTIPW